MKIILASQSKARKELLEQMGYEFDVLRLLLSQGPGCQWFRYLEGHGYEGHV